MQRDSGGRRGAFDVHHGSRQADLLLSGLAVVTFNYSYTDSVADGPVEEGLKTQDSTHPL